MIFQKGNVTFATDWATWGMDKKAIKLLLDQAGKTQAELGRHLGMSDSTVSKLLNGPRHLKAAEAEKIRRWLNQPPTPDENITAPNVRRVDTPAAIPSRSTRPKDVPILGTAWGGESGDFTMNGETAGYALRPERYEGREDIFALYVQGTSMEPRYYAGELIVVEKRRPPHNGDHVVVELLPRQDGTREAYLKVLVGRSPTKIKLAQYNPSKVIEIDLNKVGQVLRVLTTMDLLDA